MMAARKFNLTSFGIRWLIALILVLVTFNPTSYSYVQWLASSWDTDIPLKLLVGVILLICYLIFLRATWRSIGPIGVGLLVVLFGALAWVVIEYTAVDATNITLITWALLVVVATILAVGLSWSHIRRRLTGQLDVDDVEVQ